MTKQDLQSLQIKLDSQLPGWEAQKMMSPVQSERYRLNETTSKKAGVLALLYPDINQNLELIFIKRPSINSLDKHSGQLSFPGGQSEKNDLHLTDTALRETEEEIGIDKTNILVLGQLSPIYVFVSNFLVFPTVGYIDYQPQFKLQTFEVDYIITESINRLKQTSTIKNTELNIRGNILKNVPYYDLNGEILWGATAMITSELLHIVREL